MAASTHSRRLGRPPDTDSAETRQRILEIARAAFAFGGYDGSTNRELATKAGITSGALYHYFGSKLDLYLAVHEDVQQRVYGQFNKAADAAAGFLGKFDAVLDVAHELNESDPTFAAFLGAVRNDMRRHPEIADALAAHAERRHGFFVRLVDAGIDSGEIAPANRDLVNEFVAIILVGLTDGVSDDSERHELAITSIKMAMRGQLVASEPI
ncbi:MAG TPA: TetR/AcrR family transcriptional regulator [Ilumatobacteraceae bacterium]|nr:TetR/AcrR family transcriptional regulator [Ilumatobacteraceae bacterium]